MKKIIDKLNNVGQNYVDKTFNLLPKEALTYVINGKNISHAINQKKNNSLPVNVLNWFNDFWLYVEIRFVLNKSISKRKKILPNIFFTLSVFQGKVDKNKTQLFRADWDNYYDNSDNHPQPHWHIYAQREIEEQEKSFDEIVSTTDKSFIKYIEKDTKVVNIDRFHFAMNAQWSESKTDVHKIKIGSDLTDWFEGVLNHIKKELEYIKVK
ncbi:MAG: hypothetical protein JEY97_14765 [Bacteroidales bacterium]|nr:hypothetical protein [Bacteroidales bacterium]